MDIDKRTMDKISSTVVTVALIILFISNYISANQTQIQGVVAVFGVPVQYQPVAGIIFGIVIALAAYFNIKTPQQREDQRAVEVTNELLEKAHLEQDKAEAVDDDKENIA